MGLENGREPACLDAGALANSQLRSENRLEIKREVATFWHDGILCLLSPSLSIRPFICLSICPSLHPTFCPFIYILIHSAVHLSI